MIVNQEFQPTIWHALASAFYQKTEQPTDEGDTSTDESQNTETPSFTDDQQAAIADMGKMTGG